MHKPLPQSVIRLTVQAILVITLLWPLVVPVSAGAANPPEATIDPEASKPSCVALDLSGSMDQTDPDHYGPSVIDLLADLASSSVLSVFTFAGEGPNAVTPVGTFDLAKPDELEGLRQRVAELDHRTRGGNTPTAALVSAIFQHLDGQNAPAGSGCIIISDGEPQPDTERQFQEIESRIPEFAARGWKVHAVALGSGPWVQPFLGIATKLGGVAMTANTPQELISVVLHIFTAYRSDPAPQVQPVTIGADGTATVPMDLDPTIKRLAVVVTRPDTGVGAALTTPEGHEVASGDARLTGYNVDDRHYVFYGLADSASLGAGRWNVVVRGAPGTQGYVAVSQRSTLHLMITEPAGGLFLADRPGRICTQLLDGSEPLADPSATVQVTATDEAGRERTVDLRDDGRRPDSGDDLAWDGIFCGRMTLPPGNHRLAAGATTAGNGKAGTEGSLYAETFPIFKLLSQRQAIVVREGESTKVELAQLDLNGGRVDPRVVQGLALVVQPPNGGPEETVQLDPATALNEDGVLTVHFPASAEDAAESSPRGDDGAVTVPYKLVLAATYANHGQQVTDDTAVAQQLAVTVRPWPGLCGPLPGVVRPPCATVAEWTWLPWIAGIVGSLVLGLVLLNVGIRIYANRQLGGGSTGTNWDEW